MGVVTFFSILAIYYSVSNIIQIAFIFLSRRALESQPSTDHTFRYFLESQSLCPKVTFLVPAYNEEPVIVDSIKALARIFYPNIEILIINDGSRDQTQNRLIEHFQMDPLKLKRKSLVSKATIQSTWQSRSDSRIRLIEQSNAGKSTALNSGIDFAEGALVVTLDADTVAEEDSLIRLIPLFMNDPNLIGASGIIRILNGSRMANSHVSKGQLPNHPLALFQVLEYMRAFYLGRLSWDQLNATLLLPGAFTVFRKDILVAVSGFDASSIVEDFELVVRIRHWSIKNHVKANFRIIPDPVCWTQAPQKLSHLQKQRWRWQNGLISTAWKHRAFFFSKGSGIAGWVAMPYLVLFEALSPVFDIAGLGLIGHQGLTVKHAAYHVYVMLSIGAVGIIFSWTLNLIAIHWAESRYRRHKTKRPFRQWLQVAFQFASAGFLEMFFFHPIVSYWKFQALIRHYFVKQTWGQKPRTAITQSGEPSIGQDKKGAA